MLFGDEPNAFVCVYSSETGNWGNVISTAFSFGDLVYHSDILVGNSFCWLLQWGSRNTILQFDFEWQRLAQIDVPPLDMHTHWDERCRIVPAEDGGLVFLVLTDFSLDLWKNKEKILKLIYNFKNFSKNKTNCDDVAGWVLERTIQLDKLLSVEPRPRITSPCLGFVEEHNMLIVSTRIGGFLFHLESMQFKKLPQTIGMGYYYPFCSFDTKGNFFPCVFTLYI
uniref:F-box associated domain-containing protein n=1 Tax=Oryza glumipatula TaxID=40148 RepID=A0A0E0B7P4_9ORYZ